MKKIANRMNCTISILVNRNYPTPERFYINNVIKDWICNEKQNMLTVIS